MAAVFNDNPCFNVMIKNMWVTAFFQANFEYFG